MSELVAIAGGNLEVGRLYSERDSIRFAYNEDWRASRSSYPLSLSMPLAGSSYGDGVIRPYIRGLLPENQTTLRAISQQHHVSPGNPFRLLEIIGEDCPGAIQWIPSDRADTFLSGTVESGIDWITESELCSRMAELISNQEPTRLPDRGRFSLAGAQPKMALHHDDRGWGIPYGRSPTTHILKPSEERFDHFAHNEHFCLRLAEALGMRVCDSEVKDMDGLHVIVAKRYDRLAQGERVIRIHQEDMCQALARSPSQKYQSEGGPSPKDIFELLEEYSNRAKEDQGRFLDALIFNWLIAGTDAHAKNYSLLIASGQIRLAPLYDIACYLPYAFSEGNRNLRNVNSAMKVGNKYDLFRIEKHDWEQAANNWGQNVSDCFERIRNLQEKLTTFLEPVAHELGQSFDPEFSDRLLMSIRQWSARCIEKLAKTSYT